MVVVGRAAVAGDLFLYFSATVSLSDADEKSWGVRKPSGSDKAVPAGTAKGSDTEDGSANQNKAGGDHGPRTIPAGDAAQKCEHEGVINEGDGVSLCTTRRKRWPCPRRVRMEPGAITKGGWVGTEHSNPSGVQGTRDESIQRRGPGGSARGEGMMYTQGNEGSYARFL